MNTMQTTNHAPHCLCMSCLEATHVDRAETSVTFQFQTGRLYTAQGQIIVATMRGDVVTFRDMSRGIFGRIELVAREYGDPRAIARSVLAYYDGGAYQNISMSDAPKFNDALPIIEL